MSAKRVCECCGGPLSAASVYGICSRHRSCKNAANRKWNKTHQEQRRESRRRYRKKYPEKYRACQRRYNDKYPDKVKALRRKRYNKWRLLENARSRVYYYTHPEMVAECHRRSIEHQRVLRELRGSWGAGNRYLIRETDTEKKLKREIAKCSQ